RRPPPFPSTTLFRSIRALSPVGLLHDHRYQNAHVEPPSLASICTGRGLPPGAVHCIVPLRGAAVLGKISSRCLRDAAAGRPGPRSEEHTSELQSREK